MGTGRMNKMRIQYLPGFFVLLFFCFLFCGCDNALLSDDLLLARRAIADRNWSLAERLLERYLAHEQDVDKRWEAWQELLVVTRSSSIKKRITLEILDSMLAEFADDDGRAKVVLESMGLITESLKNHGRAADVWSTYIGLGGLLPSELVEGYRHLATAQFAQRHFDAGEETLAQCMALPAADKEKLLCAYDLADYQMARQRPQEVSDLCQQILDSEPDKELRGMAGYLLGDALEQLGRQGEALHQFEFAKQDYPNPLVIENRIAYLRSVMKK